jgi:hypothetical protein
MTVARRILSLITRAAALACIAGGVALLALELFVLFDLFAFEFPALLQLGGYGGLALLIAFNIGALALIVRATCFLRDRPPPLRRTSTVVLAATALLALWVLQYLFMEQPLTARTALLLRGSGTAVAAAAEGPDFAGFSLRARMSDPDSVRKLAAMYERIRLNNPAAFDRHPLGATIDKYSQRYEIDAVFLFFRSYLNSFYGEAVAGPVPFAHAMTSETIRDVVQIHLPAWFVESDTRRRLIASNALESTFGTTIGFKLRYALHKSTLDVSTQPYDLNTFSDVFLVLRNYPDEFADIFEDRAPDPLRRELRDSFRRLQAGALLAPYEQPYLRGPYDDSYYAANRQDLKRFARAAYYQTVFDFDFATRVQALLSRFQRDYFRARLGAQRWASLPDWQQIVMLAMVRDLYTPNVGRLAYNLYAIPELNCTPVDFVATQALGDQGLPPTAQSRLWLPAHPEYLWAGAGYQLRVLSEVWTLAKGESIPNLVATDTVQDALDVIWLTK